MARMIPPTVHSSVRSGAERRLFSILERAPGTHDWICIHSLGLARHGRKRRAEIDFLLITPLGVFVIEVKGGRIRREQGEWVHTDRFGDEHRKRESPFEQASSAMFALEEVVRRHIDGTRWRDVLFGYGVAFPDIEFDALGTDGDRDLVYDARDRGRPVVEYVKRLASFALGRDPRRRRGPDRRCIAELTEFLRGDFDLAPTFSTVAESTKGELESLTREQFSVLDTLETETRLIVDGPAGSGKSLLALETARRDARAGMRVLLLCYNRLLAARLRTEAAMEAYAGVLDVRTVHGWFHHLVENSTLRAEFEREAQGASQERRFGELYPEYAALAAMEANRPPVDSLVVDEAQDVLRREYLYPLGESLRGGLQDGRWRVFLDANNQASVYGGLDSTLLTELRSLGSACFLTVNCRNTRPIALHTTILAEPRRPANARVEGPPVEFLTYRTDSEQLGKLEKVLADLRHDRVANAAVTVLFARRPSDEVLRRLARLGLRELGEEDIASLPAASPDSAVRWSVVSRFKGLENDVVVLADVAEVDSGWWRAVTYVGMSRARVRLYVLLAVDADTSRRERLQRETLRRLAADGGNEA